MLAPEDFDIERLLPLLAGEDSDSASEEDEEEEVVGLLGKRKNKDTPTKGTPIKKAKMMEESSGCGECVVIILYTLGSRNGQWSTNIINFRIGRMCFFTLFGKFRTTEIYGSTYRGPGL